MLKRKINRKGLSGVITAVILIALTITLIGVIWSIVSKLVTEKIDESSSCFNLFDKITINDEFTCYDSSQGGSIQLSLSLKDVEPDRILISVVSLGTSEQFFINSEPGTVANVQTYPGLEDTISLPSNNSGKSYLIDLSGLGLGEPDSIEIAPEINGNQCEVSDSLNEIVACS